MQGSVRTVSHVNRDVAASEWQIAWLQRGLIRFSLFNFFVVAASGLLLRGIPLVGGLPLSYNNILHGHSHFAFGGWLTPALVWLVMKSFPELASRVKFAHWRNIIAMLMLSAYGMLFSFPFQGYGPVSVMFSSLSVAATYYLAIMLLRASKGSGDMPVIFLRAALFFLMVSALGPFAVGPLAAAGKAGTPLYFNCVYFYLHFQYNGWFSFVILAVLYRKFLREQTRPGRIAFALLFAGCVLSLLLSFLWDQPGLLFNIAGGAGAIAQLAGFGCLLTALFKQRVRSRLNRFEWLALSAFAFKLILQVCSAFPQVAAMAYLYRNFLIAYLHLIMLGFVTTFILSNVIRFLPSYLYHRLKAPVYVFLSTFLLSELLLVYQASSTLFGRSVPHFPLWIFLVSTAFPVCALTIYRRSALRFNRS